MEFTQCRGRDHVASSSSQYVLPHEGLTAAALKCTGHQETHKDDVAVVKTSKCESSNQSDRGRGNYRRLPKDAEGYRKIPKATESRPENLI